MAGEVRLGLLRSG